MLQRNIFLLLGSNSGDRVNQLRLAADAIEKETGHVFAKSKIYETAPWGKQDQPPFLNQALKIESQFSPDELLSKIQAIEQRLGRTRTERWGERTIDIDIIYFGDNTVNTAELVIPHPHLQERKFALVPLVEISADFIHPVLKKSNAKLLAECFDTLGVAEFIG